MRPKSRYRCRSEAAVSVAPAAARASTTVSSVRAVKPTALVSLGFRRSQLVGIGLEGGGSLPIQPRADSDEVGLWRELEVDGELSQHMLPPELLERDAAQGGAIGVAVEPHLP